MRVWKSREVRRRLTAVLCLIVCMWSLAAGASITAKTVSPDKTVSASSETAGDLTERAIPTVQELYVMRADGTEQLVTRPLPIYNIDRSNYMKIRDVGYILDFQVEYSTQWKAISIRTDWHNDGEQVSDSIAKTEETARLSPQSLYVDGQEIEGLTIYSIQGSNYIKLRDLAAVVDFGCCYSSRLRAVVLSPDFFYSNNDVMTEGGDRRIHYAGGDVIMDPTVGRTAKEHPGEFQVRLAAENLTMLPETTRRLRASVVWDDSYTTKWTSSDPEVVSVDAQGNLTAGSSGEADVIFSATADGRTETKICHVEVTTFAVATQLEETAETLRLDVLDQINALRREKGLNSLTETEELETAAKIRAKELEELYDDSRRPDSRDSATVLVEEEAACEVSKELIARGLLDPVEVAEDWLTSNRNLFLEETWVHAAVGYYEGDDGYSIYWTLILTDEKI